jgi:aminocarboxymuconate-semialdehyde decarboxylase
VLGHLGGAIPYLVERLDRGFANYPECRVNIARPPSEYLKSFYYDTVNFDTRALEFAAAFAGPSQLLAGSDYPHLIGSIPRMKSSIEAMHVSDGDKAAILGGNAAALLDLDVRGDVGGRRSEVG